MTGGGGIKSQTFSATTNAAGAVLSIDLNIGDDVVIIAAESTSPVNIRLFPFLLSGGGIGLQTMQYESGVPYLKPLPNTAITGKYYYIDKDSF